MNIPEFCVKRPIFISMVSCIVLILGGVALSYLPVDLMPDITYPGVTIVTTYEDASPEEVEELISKKIEIHLRNYSRQFATRCLDIRFLCTRCNLSIAKWTGGSLRSCAHILFAINDERQTLNICFVLTTQMSVS